MQRRASPASFGKAKVKTHRPVVTKQLYLPPLDGKSRSNVLKSSTSSSMPGGIFGSNSNNNFLKYRIALMVSVFCFMGVLSMVHIQPTMSWWWAGGRKTSDADKEHERQRSKFQQASHININEYYHKLFPRMAPWIDGYVGFHNSRVFYQVRVVSSFKKQRKKVVIQKIIIVWFEI
jgi:hypothetical protein